MTNQAIDNLQKDLQKLENNTEARDIFRLAQARNKALSQSDSKQRNRLFPALGASMASILLVSFFFRIYITDKLIIHRCWCLLKKEK